MSLWDRLSNSSTKIDIPNLPKKFMKILCGHVQCVIIKLRIGLLSVNRCGSIGSFYWLKSKISPSEINLNKGFFLS